MKLNAVISSLALATALSFSGGASAQAMIGDVTIPQENLGDFTAKCAAIASASTETLAEPVNEDETATGSVTDPATATTDPDLASKDNLDQLLASVTVDQCKEAGLLPGGPNAVTSQ